MTPNNEADEFAIRKAIDAVEAGWNAGDGSYFAAPFAEDADYVIVDGRSIKGRQVIAEGHQRLFETVYRNSHNIASVQRLRFIGANVAIVHVEWRLTFQQNEVARNARAMSTMVMTKANDTWSITAFQNTPIVAS